MTAIAPTEVSVLDIPMVLNYGTHKKRVQIFLRADSTTNSDTINLATYVPGLQDIEGITFQTLDGAINVITATWVTTTLTLAGAGGSGVAEFGIIGTM